MKKRTTGTGTVKGSELVQFVFMTALFFSFWLIMSGVFKPRMMIIGFITSVTVALITRPLMRLKSVNAARNNVYLVFHFPYFRFVLYCFWLLKEIVKSSIYVLKLIIHPKMPISPTVVILENNFDNPMAVVALGKSITLTPGTVIIVVEDGLYHIHAITQEAALEVVPLDGRETDLVRRVATLFGEERQTGNNTQAKRELGS